MGKVKLRSRQINVKENLPIYQRRPSTILFLFSFFVTSFACQKKPILAEREETPLEQEEPQASALGHLPAVTADTPLSLPERSNFNSLRWGTIVSSYELEQDEKNTLTLTYKWDDGAYRLPTYNCKIPLEENSQLSFDSILEEIESADICISQSQKTINDHCAGPYAVIRYKENSLHPNLKLSRDKEEYLFIPFTPDYQCRFQFAYFCDISLFKKMDDKLKEAYPQPESEEFDEQYCEMVEE